MPPVSITESALPHNVRTFQVGNGGSSLLLLRVRILSCNDAGGDVKLGSSLNLQDNPHTPPSQSSPSNNGPEPFLSPPSHGCHFCAVNQLRTFCKPRNASVPACQWPPSSVTSRCFVRILSLHLIWKIPVAFGERRTHHSTTTNVQRQ